MRLLRSLYTLLFPGFRNLQVPFSASLIMSSPTNPYAKVHAAPKGEGDARPTAMQIIEDEHLIGKMSGKVCLVTGSSNGIGLETARALHATGADVCTLSPQSPPFGNN